jgi:hypothetical protein
MTSICTILSIPAPQALPHTPCLGCSHPPVMWGSSKSDRNFVG